MVEPLEDVDWEDVRVFLALLESATLTEAAERLQVNATTAARRLSHLEETVGARLFERGRHGLRRTSAAEQLAPAARNFARAAAGFSQATRGLERAPEGRVVISAPSVVASTLLAPLVTRLVDEHPGLRVEIDTNNAFVDLDRHEADIALRAMSAGRPLPAGDNLIATRLSTATLVPVASPAFARAAPRTLKDLDALRWVTFGERTAAFSWARKVLQNVSPDRVVLRSDDAHTLLSAVQAGVGATWMTRIFCDGERLVELRLAKALRGLLDEEESLWLVTHRSLRDVPRVAAAWSFLRAQLTTPARAPVQ